MYLILYIYPMKKLYIVRHAKSSWEDPELRDHDRPLLPKGIKKTGKIAGFLKKKNIKPDLMISSTAVRAYETAKIIAKELAYPLDEILKEPSFYHSDAANIQSCLYGLDNAINSVMIFGHNPTFTTLANEFLPEPIEWLPTSAVVGVKIDTDKWEEMMFNDLETEFIVSPKML